MPENAKSTDEEETAGNNVRRILKFYMFGNFLDTNIFVIKKIFFENSGAEHYKFNSCFLKNAMFRMKWKKFTKHLILAWMNH